MKVRELVTLGSLDPRRLLWHLTPFVAVETFCGQGLLCLVGTFCGPLGSSQSFCGLCLKIVVRDSISAQKEIISGR